MERSRQRHQRLRGLHRLLIQMRSLFRRRHRQTAAIVLLVTIELTVDIVCLFVTIVGSNKAQAALVDVGIGPLCELQLLAALDNELRIVNDDMSIGIDVPPGIDDLAEFLVADILVQHLLGGNDKGMAATALTGREGERLDIVIVHKIQRTLCRPEPCLDHAVADLVIVDIKLLCQLSADKLQLIPHVALAARGLQFLADPLFQQAPGHLQTAPTVPGLPFDPLHRTALSCLHLDRLPLRQPADIVVMQSLQLEEKSVLDIMEALMVHRIAAERRGLIIDNNRIRRDLHHLRLLVIAESSLHLHLARAEEQNAGGLPFLVQRQMNDLQSESFCKKRSTQITRVL